MDQPAKARPTHAMARQSLCRANGASPSRHCDPIVASALPERYVIGTIDAPLGLFARRHRELRAV